MNKVCTALIQMTILCTLLSIANATEVKRDEIHSWFLTKDQVVECGGEFRDEFILKLVALKEQGDQARLDYIETYNPLTLLYRKITSPITGSIEEGLEMNIESTNEDDGSTRFSYYLSDRRISEPLFRRLKRDEDHALDDVLVPLTINTGCGVRYLSNMTESELESYKIDRVNVDGDTLHHGAAVSEDGTVL